MKIQLKNYQLVGWKWGNKCAFGKFGTIELDKLTEKQADLLISQGFKHLKKVEAKEEKATKKNEKNNKEL